MIFINLKCFDKVEVHNIKIRDYRIEATYTLFFNRNRKEYRLIETYKDPIKIKGINEIAGLISMVPAINYGLFSEEIKINYPVNNLDAKFFMDMMDITSREIFVNKIAYKTGLIKEEYIPKEEDISKEDAKPMANINFKKMDSGTVIDFEPNYNSSGIMTSGGKDSLTTYGLLKEIGFKTYPFFINESGRHWIVSLKAYRYLNKIDSHTKRVWSNIDRLFAFIEKNMKIVVPNYWRKSRETYPIRTFWFEHYVFSYLPYLIKYRIGNVSLGNEYDDPTGLSYEFKGIKHYYGVYDQSQEFDKYMTKWFEERGLYIRQWSPIRPISGLIVERILYNRYNNLFLQQTSCHSSHLEKDEVIPCGKCSKCTGILIFLLANGIDPHLIRYSSDSIRLLPQRIGKHMYRLDQSELEHSLYLINSRFKWSLTPSKPHWHVEMIHFDPRNSHIDNIPYIKVREKIYRIFEKYTKGYVFLKDEKWIKISREEALDVKMLGLAK